MGINKRLSEISSSEEVFRKAIPPYQKALNESGYDYELQYQQNQTTTEDKRRRKRNVIWYNPPFDLNVKTNIGKEFLKIIAKCFPRSNKLYKIFNKNTLKLSYSCMPNVKSLIAGSNKRLRRKNNNHVEERKCNCPRNAECPLGGECLTKDIVYQATVTCQEKEETYVGVTATTFKSRLANHKSTFKAENKRNSTELSKYIWHLKDSNLNYAIKWKILSRASHYSNTTKRCNLCITEKFFILCIILIGNLEQAKWID